MTKFPDRKTVTARVDHLVLQQGRLDPLELLLSLDLLPYEDYEAWRTSHRADLQGALLADPTEVAALLEQAAGHACGQGLEPSPLEHRGWGDNDAPLRLGANHRLTQACAAVFAPAANRRQLDLFHDSTALLLENGIRDALAGRRIDEARDRIGELMRHDPHHASLQGYLRLMQTADEHVGADAGDELPGAFDPADRLAQLDAIEPAARELLGYQARDFLTTLWAGLARQLAGADYDPASPRLHASHAWLRAERWDAVRMAIETETDWRRHPDLVALHAEAAWRRQDPATARLDWAWLCWEHPHHAERVLGSAKLPDPHLRELLNAFDDLDDCLEIEEFPAWLLLHDSATAAAVSPEQAPDDERGTVYGLLHGLVSGDDGIELRRQLDDIHPSLLRLFLASRGQR
ncbi:MAG: hypothetical protein WBG92_10750 [Thiohalocapsa sp.]